MGVPVCSRLLQSGRAAAVLLLLVGSAAWGPLAADQRPALRIEMSPRALRPGQVALVTVRAPAPLLSVEGEAFDQAVVFWPTEYAATEAGLVWQGLVAVPVDAPAGTHELSLTATTDDGKVMPARARLRTVAARFATRRLTVDPRFANPPASALPRIEEESRILAEVFGAPATARAWRGAFSRPVKGASTSSFGRLSIINGERRGRHMGADFKAGVGTPVVAPNAGTVVLAADRYLAGQTVVVDHGAGLFSLFAHLSGMAVKAGDRVERGTLLGQAGATGRVTGPHLHWSVRVGGTTVDPLSLVAVLDAPPPDVSPSPPRPR